MGSRLRTTDRLQLGKIHRFAEVGATYLSHQRLRLDRILARSNHRFAPIGDPLTINFGLNRWLIAEREEAYSDWLAWIFGEIGTNHLLTLLFGQSPPHGFDGNPTVKREECVPEGHIGHSGRLDIVLRFVNAVIVIEVKMPEATNLEKHQGYRSWLDHQPEKIKLAFLITVGNIVDKHGGFASLSWGTLCGRMRQILPRLIQEQCIILAAIVGAFVGAVEQNLLGYPALINQFISRSTFVDYAVVE